jgi:hypothetical protein
VDVHACLALWTGPCGRGTDITDPVITDIVITDKAIKAIDTEITDDPVITDMVIIDKAIRVIDTDITDPVVTDMVTAEPGSTAPVTNPRRGGVRTLDTSLRRNSLSAATATAAAKLNRPLSPRVPACSLGPSRGGVSAASAPARISRVLRCRVTAD